MREALFSIIMVIATLAGCATTNAPNRGTMAATQKTPNYNWEPCRGTTPKKEFEGNPLKFQKFCDKKSSLFMAACPIVEGSGMQLDACVSMHGRSQCDDGGCYPVDLSGFPPYQEALKRLRSNAKN